MSLLQGLFRQPCHSNEPIPPPIPLEHLSVHLSDYKINVRQRNFEKEEHMSKLGLVSKSLQQLEDTKSKPMFLNTCFSFKSRDSKNVSSKRYRDYPLPITSESAFHHVLFSEIRSGFLVDPALESRKFERSLASNLWPTQDFKKEVLTTTCKKPSWSPDRIDWIHRRRRCRELNLKAIVAQQMKQNEEKEKKEKLLKQLKKRTQSELEWMFPQLKETTHVPIERVTSRTCPFCYNTIFVCEGVEYNRQLCTCSP